MLQNKDNQTFRGKPVVVFKSSCRLNLMGLPRKESPLQLASKDFPKCSRHPSLWL